jgi:hypothetical protein
MPMFETSTASGPRPNNTGKHDMNTFANIDVNKLASSKQFNGVCAHYTNIIAKAQSLTQAESYILYKRMRGAIGHYFGTVLESRMTHGDAQVAFASTTVPSEIMTLIKIKDQKPTAQEAPKKAGRPKGSKNKAKPEPEIEAYKSKNFQACESEGCAENSVAKDLDARVLELETKVTTLDSKLDAILNILQAK